MHERSEDSAGPAWRCFPTSPLLSSSCFWWVSGNCRLCSRATIADLAEKNRIRSIPIIAPRGAMLDREGRVLVDSYPSFSILLLRDDPKLVEKNLPQIEDGLGICR